MTMVSYGYFGDLMKHSENFRWLGRGRYDLSGVRTFLAHRSYKGRIQYTPTSSPSSLLHGSCGQGCPNCFTEGGGPEGGGETGGGGVGGEAGGAGAGAAVEKEMVSLEGRFLAVTSATMTCSCRHTRPGISPGAHTGDGSTDLILVKRTGHLNYLRYLVRVAFNRSSSFSLPFVEAVRVREWTFTDMEPAGRSSVWNCDGEILEEPSIAVRVHQQAVPVFARGVYNEKISKMPSENEDDIFHSSGSFLLD